MAIPHIVAHLVIFAILFLDVSLSPLHLLLQRIEPDLVHRFNMYPELGTAPGSGPGLMGA